MNSKLQKEWEEKLNKVTAKCEAELKAIKQQFESENETLKREKNIKVK